MKSKSLNVTLLAAGAVIHGDLILDHGVSTFALVNGGIISTAGLLHVGQGGMVKGRIQGEYVRVDGAVEGDVHAREMLEINGRVKGNVYYCGTIRLGPNAALDGQISRVARERVIENAANPVQQLAPAESTVPVEAAIAL
ncbi:TPA: polymer-forming cytoskeletal protein [Burkholderia vietnamiensis]|jgi:cytoskeletal protein CcmA (bactofilin family)|uniref:Polymer-forming cytoskeletal protein n=1 Tax=Burkholderia vietnamiensis TaxID=60552 RepID=A0AA44Y3P0_BURVI|nr:MULTISPECIES: polymer-forming cytoskeletal protein [Burkholderia]AOK42535.1 cell shape determination protein CcmA [Burkholderia vietnamiensis]KVE17629.1 cell shape determination protein CcmA [Burkholderia vietnamiensis]KVF62670.1 cell shape determination protein CcmA [Burkholderia vietnamiensis]KVR82514.1 cell shape determination protein CcmA [Burkholderia vietnamiensis]KVR90009.1 cell shape determination protein CcmA [Burkholderia vietnamiensis]